MSDDGKIVGGFIVPGQPHPLLVPEANPGYQALHDAYGKARDWIAASGAELLMLYSTQWLSVIGHQIQADPAPKWTHVDQEWHELGSIPYEFRMDADHAAAYEAAARARGLEARRVAYRGFPIDTGTIVALKLLNPDNAVPACVVSCNMYADRAETLVLGKAAMDAVRATGRKTVAVAVTGLSHRYFTEPVPFEEDRIHSDKDDEWNRKILEFLAEGRLEDVSQLAREVSRQANGDQRLKAIWWLAALMGQDNAYEGEVYAYEPVYGTGAAVVRLTPTDAPAAQKEFDEDDVEFFRGDREVLGGSGEPEPEAPESPGPAPAPVATVAAPIRQAAPQTRAVSVSADGAPKPVGAYPHARQVGDMIYVSGMGPRQPGSDEIPGGPVRDRTGFSLDYDVEAQTRATIENVRRVLEAAGSSLERVVDVTAFLIDMERDFAGYNKIYAEYFGGIQPTRTTLEVKALPTPIAVELKVIALAGK